MEHPPPEEEESGSDYDDEDDEDDDYYDDDDDGLEVDDMDELDDDRAEEDLVDAILQRDGDGGGGINNNNDGVLEDWIGAERLRARVEGLRRFHHRRPRFFNEHPRLHRVVKLLLHLGLHHRVLVLFLFDGILNGSALKLIRMDEEPASSSLLAFSLLFLSFLVGVFLFLVPIDAVYEFLRVFGGGYVPIFAAFSINYPYVKSLTTTTTLNDANAADSPPTTSASSSPTDSPPSASYSIILVLLSALHLELTIADLDIETDALIAEDFKLDLARRVAAAAAADVENASTSSSAGSLTPPTAATAEGPTTTTKFSWKRKAIRLLWIFLRLSSIVSLISPYLVASSLLPFVPLASSHWWPGFLVPMTVVTLALVKRSPCYWRRSSTAVKRLVNVFGRNVNNFGAPGVLYFLEDHWNRMKLPPVLRAFFAWRLVCQCVDLFIVTGKHPVDGYPIQPATNAIILLKNFYENSTTSSISSSSNATSTPFDSRDFFLSLVIPSRWQSCPASTPIPPSSIAFSPLVILLVNGVDTCCALVGFASWISLITYHLGQGIQNFLGLDDDPERGEDGGNMGAVGSILFFILGVQTGLTGMEPEKRLVRLYKNFSLLMVALLHYVHSLVHPQLESLSLPASRYARTFVVCAVLIWFPVGLIAFLWTRFSASTWLFAVTVFGLELIIKVVLSLAIFVLFKIDANSEELWEPLDDYIYWVRAVGSSVEFLFAVFLFCNGAWIMLFESGGTIRAVMMCIHAYYNIWQQALLSWDRYNKRRQSVVKIDSMRDATEAQLAQHRDVCAICYNDLISAKVTVCNHFFHASCLKKWLYLQDNCPMCHQDIFAADRAKEAADRAREAAAMIAALEDGPL